MIYKSFSVTCLVVLLSMSACSQKTITGMNSSDPFIAEQAQKASDLQIQVDNQKKVVDTEKSRLKALQEQLIGAKRNLSGRLMTPKS